MRFFSVMFEFFVLSVVFFWKGRRENIAIGV